MADARSPILIVHQSSELYGSDRMLLRLLAACSQDRPVTLHLPFDGPLVAQAREHAASLIIKPMSVLRLASLKSLAWLNPMRFYRNARFAWQQLQRHDTVIINSCVVIGYLMLLPFYRGRKIVYVHEITSGVMTYAFNILLALTGAQLICNSRVTADHYPLVSNTKKHVIYNVTEPSSQPVPIDPHDGLRLLLIGRISERKGHHVLLQALNQLSDAEKSAIHLRIVGGSFGKHSTYGDEIKHYIETHRLQSMVTLHDFAEDPTDHYQWTDCVVIPSIKAESFGLVALEAMHHQRAVIASRIGALPEVVVDKTTGVLVTPNAPDDLVRVIRTYRSQPSLLAQHGQAGLIKAQQDYQFDSYKHAIERLLHMPVQTSHYLKTVLTWCGKSYDPDPHVPLGYIVKTCIRRVVWLIRGFVRLQARVFIGRHVVIDGSRNLSVGDFATIDPYVWINAVARHKVRLGRSVRIGAFSRILCTAHLSKVGKGFSIGDQSGCGEYCLFGAAGGIAIGNRVMIGQYVSMHAQDHVYDDITTPIQQQGTTEKGIQIGDDCWIGAKVTILDGTVIGKHCVVAAGAVVKGTFPDYTVIGGVPAKIIKSLHENNT